jgi:hypothetical protein
VVNDVFVISELTYEQSGESKKKFAESAPFSHATNCLNKAGCDHKQLCAAHQYFKGHVATTAGIHSMTSQMKGFTH